jgi:hypothetical protein
MTVGEILARIRRRTNLNYDQEPRSLFLSLINEAYRDMVSLAEYCRSWHKYTYSEADNPESTFIVDPDVQRVIMVTFDDVELRPISHGEFGDTTGFPSHYQFEASRIVLWRHCGTSEEGKLLKVFVSTMPDDDLEDDSDIPVMPDQFEPGLIEYCVYNLLTMPNYANAGLAGLAMTQYEKIKRDFQSWTRKNRASAIRGDKLRALTLRR